jgi:thiol-disulfide isomerase/thioredoxin
MSRPGWRRIILLAFAIGMGSHAPAANPVIMGWDWQTRPPAFDPAATPSQSPILLYFTADWCGFCKQMERTTLTDPAVRMQITMLAHVKVDLDQEEELAKQFGVEGIPAFLLVNERGEDISRTVGVTAPPAFLSWLEAGEKRASGIALAAQKRTAELRRLADAAASKDPAVQATVREQAFGFIGRGEPAARKFAADYLGHLAEDDPEALLDGLANPDLAVRIAVADILRSKFGDELGFDPWSTADERRTAIEKLRKTITERTGKLSP